MKKPREIILDTYGSKISFNVDSKMSNIWISHKVPVDFKNAKKLKKWLDEYLKWAELKGE